MQRVSSIARSLACLSLLVASASSTSWADELSKKRDAELAAKLEAICRKHDVPAMTVAVVDTNGLLTSQCWGIRKRETSSKVQLSDRFPIGSCTKSMTATLAAVMVDAGKIDWDTSIGDVWPKASDDDIHPKLRKVTLAEFAFSSEWTTRWHFGYLSQVVGSFLRRKAISGLGTPTHAQTCTF